MVKNLSHKDQKLWLVYITIRNLDAKLRQSQKRSKTLLWALSLLFMSDRKMQTIKIRIWRPKSIIWLQRLYYSILILVSLLFSLRKWDADNVIVLLEYTKEGIELVYANGYKRCCHSILAGFMMDYKDQVLIIDIKVNMQCSICHVLLKEKELITRS